MLLGAVLVLFLLGGAGTASAHAALKGSDPVDGSVLDAAPRDITLRFTESVSLLEDSIRVVDPENRAVDTGKPGRAGGRADTASVTLPTGLDDGTYTIAWRVVSADSHPISGALLFSIGEPSATAAVLPADLTEDPLTSSLYDITRYFAYGALALLIGVTFFLAVVLGGPSEALRRLLLAGWLALLLASAVLLLLRGPYERGTGVGAALDLSVLRDTMVSRPGLALLARLALLAVAALLLVRVRGQGQRGEQGQERGREEWGKGALVSGALLSVGLAGTWAAAEHASAGIQVPVAMTSSVLHLLAMAVWLGGLTALLTVLYRAPNTLSAAVVNRFSRLAFVSVIVLVVTGVYQSWRGLGSWSAFTSTAYGEVLVAKLVAVLLLLVAAAFSRRWTGRLGEASAEAGAEASAVDEAAGPAEAVGSAEGAASTTVAEPVRTASVQAGESVQAADRAEVTARATVAVAARGPERVGTTDSEASDGGADGPSGGLGDAVPGDREGSAAEDPSAADPLRQGLRRSVLAEFTVAVVVLVITTVLTGTLPGRAAAEIAKESAGGAAGGVTASSTTIPFDVGTPNGHGKVQIDLGPGRVGKNSVQAVVFGPDNGIATVPELRLTFTLRAQKIGPIDAKITDRGGYWVTDDLQLPLPGKWTMKLTVRTTEIDQVTVEKSVRVS
ncbi:copper resistance CopC/CopD family protein [Streptomyces europaeiscabiei]|uniref:copper resistance CopC/CopD family protein n=1 Tax=Streptomyces europaeiscabiei TaxID=146819 RepID=UPI0029B6E2F4|nr:copper resistance protein CopC [Streptomyces europaeiscabiei]MDX3841818.1 copper resistance protein CopC [Streptomyces europaeiscabiei]